MSTRRKTFGCGYTVDSGKLSRLRQPIRNIKKLSTKHTKNTKYVVSIVILAWPLCYGISKSLKGRAQRTQRSTTSTKNTNLVAVVIRRGRRATVF